MILAFLLAAALAATEPQRPADPITDHLRFELARAEKDFVLAKLQYDAAAERLRAKGKEAETLCAAAQKTYDPPTYVCVVKESK